MVSCKVVYESRSTLPVRRIFIYCSVPRCAFSPLEPLASKALFKASVLSAAKSASLKTLYICCVVSLTSCNFVGSPSIPSFNLFVARVASSVLAPIAVKTLGNWFNLSKRVTAPSIEPFKTSNAALPNLTSPIALTMSPMPRLALADLPSNWSN